MKRYVLLCCILPLAACDNNSVRDTLGISRSAPDEFEVISRPPLSVPPDFNLRPPAGPGEATAAAGSISPRQDAQGLVLGGKSGLAPGSADTAVMPVQAGALPDNADAQFLKNAGADSPNDDIRATLTKEAPPLAEDRSLLQKIRTDSDNQPVVNPAAEAQRIQADKAAGKPVTTGDTPMETPSNTGPLGRLLGY